MILIVIFGVDFTIKAMVEFFLQLLNKIIMKNKYLVANIDELFN
ncbi:unnamed protein product [Spirodela intermedia]|uniref:Uncharacterized protein n=1 Tax=Spirodela intermedia TaxID=51605 RepID=A0A7I8IK01_SPIIN|nr:unnamed protein product [Spirodela intermedia]CAA6657478.1 unnamed protein product [Spirodela intermedia]